MRYTAALLNRLNVMKCQYSAISEPLLLLLYCPVTDTDGDGSINEDCAVYVPLATFPTVAPTIAYNVSTGSNSTSTSPAGPVVAIPGPVGPEGPIGVPGDVGAPGVPGYNGVAGIPGMWCDWKCAW